jgi:hypothetical protein
MAILIGSVIVLAIVLLGVTPVVILIHGRMKAGKGK